MGNVEKLIKKLTDKKAENRKMAIIELGNLGDSSAVDPIITRLQDDDEDVRLWAAATLGKFKDERALEPLVKIVMRDPTDKVRKEAAGAVVKIVPSFDDVNIDLVIKKIESIYEEFTTDLEIEAEQKATIEKIEAQGDYLKEKQNQEKYFEQLQEVQKEETIEEQWVDRPPVPEEKGGVVVELPTPEDSSAQDSMESADTRPPPALVVPTERIRPKPLPKVSKPTKKEVKPTKKESKGKLIIRDR